MSSAVRAGRRALICGSLAFDTIMVFGDRFANHILPDMIHILNVSFLVPQMRREYGGCAGNIAYNLALLGDKGVPMATVGSDFGEYRERLARADIPTEHVRVIDSELTAQAFITTDLDDNQITAFHPGAMQHSHANRVSEARDIALGIVAPDGREGMIEHAAQFAAAGIPFIFDPGQGLPMFGPEELQRFLSQARWVTVNDYEWQLLQQKSRWGVREITSRVEALIVTLGAAGSVIHTRGEEILVPAAPVREVVDPTGCGDAFRAGIIHGLLHGLDWRATGHIASLMGSIKVEARGTQNHCFTRAEFDERLARAFS
ncbi:MAG TPA: carbohydrate kinase family protein [Steroidobacteraceae bacterium]|nr:carbohydrate kinase family protein [Steroidobacteraceae bacterium]